jgi:hypothetical protein
MFDAQFALPERTAAVVHVPRNRAREVGTSGIIAAFRAIANRENHEHWRFIVLVSHPMLSSLRILPVIEAKTPSFGEAAARSLHSTLAQLLRIRHVSFQ